MIAKQIKFLIVAAVKKCTSTRFLRKERGKKAPSRARTTRIWNYFCRMRSSHQPRFLLLPSSVSVCSDASVLVSSQAYGSRKRAWLGTSFSPILSTRIIQHKCRCHSLQALETYWKAEMCSLSNEVQKLCISRRSWLTVSFLSWPAWPVSAPYMRGRNWSCSILIAHCVTHRK